MRARFSSVIVVGLVFLAGVTSARADLITGSNGLNNLGRFHGTFSYSYSDSNHATLVIQLTNTSDPDNGGYLTAFAFNNPGNHITGASLHSTDGDFRLLGRSSFQNRINAPPYGRFDLGAGIGRSFRGGGSPHRGIAVGETETFTFTLSGHHLDGLTAFTFLTEPSNDPKNSQESQAFVARFRGFDVRCRSEDDVVALDPPPRPINTPEPSALILAGMGVGCALTAAFRWRLQRVTAA
jgi:hypothetical protein